MLRITVLWYPSIQVPIFFAKNGLFSFRAKNESGLQSKPAKEIFPE
jgi:hypothetical protein